MIANWVLVVVIGGFTSLADVKTVAMTERQCKAAVEELRPIKRNGLEVTCVGPNGEKYNFSDVLD